MVTTLTLAPSRRPGAEGHAWNSISKTVSTAAGEITRANKYDPESIWEAIDVAGPGYVEAGAGFDMSTDIWRSTVPSCLKPT